MGQALTNPGVQSPNGQTQFFPSPGAAGIALARQAAMTAQPATADISGTVDNPGTPTYSTPPAGPQPRMVRPSFMQAAESGPYGMPNAASPGLSKAGKLVTLLTSGLQGAVAGRAAQEQMAAQSGGRRAGGVGVGFQAGYQLPFQRAQEAQGMAQQAAQTNLTQQQGTMVQTPYGPLPAALAKAILPASIREQGTLGAAGIRAGATEQAAQTGAASRERVAQINQGQAVPVDEDTAKLAGFPELAGQKVGRGTWTNINKAMEAKGYRVQDMGKNGTDDNSGMWLMDRAGTRIRQVSPNSLTFQRGASFAQNRPEVVTDPNDPGYAYYTSAAQAMNQNLPAPQGAASMAARTEARSEVPTKIGDQKVAFNTALQHAQLLEQTLTALNNGDVKVINSLKNRFQTEFGSADVTNFKVVANAYAREISKMLAAGHMTDSEIASAGGTLPSNASPQQILGALQAYRGLAQSKLNMLNQQAGAARNRPRNAPTTNQPTRTIVF